MKYVKEYAPYVIAILVIILLRLYVVSPVQVDGTSMVPTLQNNQILLLKKYDHQYDRFKIVVLKYNNEKLVKRIIGLPKEHIQYVDNVLYINGKEVEEPFQHGETSDFDLKEIGYDTIPEGYYFVVGDNRGSSLDSRYIGLISKKQIEGSVNFSIFPFNTFGKIH